MFSCAQGSKNLKRYLILLNSSPWRIVSDCGGAFTMGCVGGALFGFVGGARNAPAGFNRRAIGGLVRMRERGNFIFYKIYHNFSFRFLIYVVGMSKKKLPI